MTNDIKGKTKAFENAKLSGAFIQGFAVTSDYGLSFKTGCFPVSSCSSICPSYSLSKCIIGNMWASFFFLKFIYSRQTTELARKVENEPQGLTVEGRHQQWHTELYCQVHCVIT